MVAGQSEGPEEAVRRRPFDFNRVQHHDMTAGAYETHQPLLICGRDRAGRADDDQPVARKCIRAGSPGDVIAQRAESIARTFRNRCPPRPRQTLR